MSTREKQRRGFKPWHYIVGGILAFVVLIAGTWALYWAIGPQTPEQRTNFTETMLHIIGGLALVTGLYFTWQTLRVNRATQKANEEADREGERISREGQITALYTQAVGQLGSEHREVRLGGIYALERIARDSHKDYQQIIEVLCAYIRENASRWPTSAVKRPSKQLAVHRSEGSRARPRVHFAVGTAASPAILQPKEDIQAALNVLRHRRCHRGAGESFVINLSWTDLRGAYLSRVHLEGAELRGADLRGAVLHKAHLEEARLEAARLEAATLWQVNLEAANLRLAHLEEADLHEARLQRADLAGADLDGAYLDGAILQGGLASTRHLTWEQISVATILDTNGDTIWKGGAGDRDALIRLLPHDVEVPDERMADTAAPLSDFPDP